MTLVPLTECCLWLGVDPKTLRLWLKAAHLSCCLHPGDARLKCLTLPQLQQVAELHGRPLPTALPALAPEPEALPACAPASQQGSAAVSPHPDEAEWRHQLSLLQQQVSTLQAQVTELALVLVRGSLAHCCQPATSRSAPLAAPGAPCAPASTTAVDSVPARVNVLAPRAVPAEPERTRARSRALPLIQVRTDGSVVVIAPTQGVLPLVPDSPEWFAWLSSLEAFSFEDPSSRFSATRKFHQGQRIQSWNVHRSLHGRSCTLYLGLTPTLTLARLQEMAVAVHTRLTTL
jgi:hypothetical protein